MGIGLYRIMVVQFQIPLLYNGMDRILKMCGKFNKTDFKNIIILSAITLVIGISLIAATAVISKDGVSYIEYAKMFSAKGWVEALSDMRGCAGYPFAIYLTHTVLDFFSHTESLQRWIVSAQITSLCSKLAASAVLYVIGSCFVGRKLAFWGVLILSVLPDSAEHSSDVLTEWTYLMFLAIGFLLLLSGSGGNRVWMFGLAGIAAALGYLVRSEGCQLLFYGGLWLTFCLIKPHAKMSRPQALLALILLTAGFAVVWPYMKLTGYVFPRQELFKLAEVVKENIRVTNECSGSGCVAGIISGKVMGDKNLIKNICETLVYYFVPFLFVGGWHYFHKQSREAWQKFYPAIFIVFNVAMLLFQTSWQHFISRRHSLPLVVFTIFYIAAGIEIASNWIGVKVGRGRLRLFYILIIIGVVLCLAKMTNRCIMQKYGYRDAAVWLSNNTAVSDIIVVPDRRIAFYAERNMIEYSDEEKILEPVDFIVQVVKDGKGRRPEAGKEVQDVYSIWVDREKKKKITIWSVR
jgi:hypothetical protein